MENLRKGAIAGLPIALGYIAVSFAFGLKAVTDGLPAYLAVLISMTNLTSAGQVAGEQLIVAGAPYIEIAVTVFVINLRYMLMSFALSMRLSKGRGKRALVAFGVTDEVFGVSMTTPGKLTFSYMAGMIFVAFWGWTAGTALGALASEILPVGVQTALRIAIYCMFIAIIVPRVRAHLGVFLVVAVAAGISCVFTYLVPQVTEGWSIIIAGIAAAALGAAVLKDEKEAQT